jgi:hypothetical protein
LSTGQHAAIYARAEAHFTSAILLKPYPAPPTNTLAAQLAPLLLIEDGGAVSLETFRDVPVVFFNERRIRLHGRTHDQVSYAWQAGSRGAHAEGLAGWQGIRITLSRTGQPAVWEVLRDSSGADVVYVSQNVEAAALREFGPALAERRFAVERAVTEAPNVVVARVIDDGPVPMGPIVHLSANTGDVSTLICRCMPSQTKRLAGQLGYELRPAEAKHGDVRADADPDLPAFLVDSLEDANDAGPELRHLRLPRAF